MESFSITSLIRSRIRHEWRLLLAVLMGIVVASALVAAAPVYMRSLNQLAFDTAIDRAAPDYLDVQVSVPVFPEELTGLGADSLVREALNSSLAELNAGIERFNRVGPYALAILEPSLDGSIDGGRLDFMGFAQHFTNLADHVGFQAGQMASDVISYEEGVPVIEGVVGEKGGQHFDLAPGDEIAIASTSFARVGVIVRIAGIFSARDISDPYWRQIADLWINPSPRDVGGGSLEPPLAIFITEKGLIEGIAGAYPDTQTTSNWYLNVDRDALKEMAPDEVNDRLEAAKAELGSAVRGARPVTGVRSILDDLERRIFLASIPLMLLLTMMVATVLYYLAMMVSYLVVSRAPDVALMRSRGTSLFQFLRLLALEGSVLIVVSAAVAPFIAMGMVTLAGKLPYFEQITGGDLVAVKLGYLPFLVAGATGVACLVVFVAPAVLAARTGLIMHRLRSSRPPTVPVYQRYYLDVALIAIVGMLFWEFYLRGEFVAGGLFSDVDVNEALMVAPLLFMAAVSLIFLRFFPLVLRYVSGESASLVHLLAGATTVTVAGGLIVQGVRGDNPEGWLSPIVVLAGFTLAYAATNRTSRPGRVLAGWLVQGGLIALYLQFEPFSRGETAFWPTVAFLVLLPAQMVFTGLRRLADTSPVWLSIALVNMARNPLQYGWLVLLMVIVTGLGILSTTVRGTLDRSLEDRILYSVGSDFRVTGIQTPLGQGPDVLKELLLSIPGIQEVSGAWRAGGAKGTGEGTHRFEVLAVGSSTFGRVAWFRDDFSSSSLGALMESLESPASAEPMMLPDGATHVRVWVNPAKKYRNVSLQLVIRDQDGLMETIFADTLGEPGWTLMSAAIPDNLRPPFELVSIQIYQPGFGPVGTVGSLYLDDIQATGQDGKTHLLDDFEGPANWIPLPTSEISSDSLGTTSSEFVSGIRAARFDFGKETNSGIRGIYRGSGDGSLPIVVSSSFLEATESHIGDSFLVRLGQRLTPVTITDEVAFFPTMSDKSGVGFIVVDLWSLLDRLNMLSPIHPTSPGEMFISVAANQDHRSVLESLEGMRLAVQDRESALDTARLDPLTDAGWRAMVILSVGIVVFTAAMGYLVYLLSFAQRSRTEVGILQSMGISRRQMAGLFGVEHLLVAILGLGLGTWVGYRMSQTMVSALAVGGRGEAIVPPVRLMTDWTVMGPLFVVLVGIFSIALVMLSRGMSRLDLSAITRLEVG